mmetsp:Transcript_24164/g.52788  ORF Transcript_24164/g.52788 Transcript_24164/m.52788 type:complete len:219 (-) Transcript_24164:385-1041(-)|eukprot:CAMPEP_0202892706 /NCGR_PEP_ID=MMETSP1392-20130828/2410_1 /ASSEMBLY_ACC=CAM_ASM_000868 /TAXON_ID=225041 /ORGANISM="Chlamydomonas chlamydogama, Strain SAG 11-48b" /LENGTH=218 /DNA_ID=CAMNT_0049576765 /DNA_START=89 /DNA_END=745 /DNA_ORIENTATION=-
MAGRAHNFTGAEEDAIIKNRFLTQAAVSRGEPPLKKLVKRFVELCEKAENGDQAHAEEALRALMRESSMIELQALKLKAICDANKREQLMYVEKQRQMEQAIEQAKLDIEAKKKELEEARLVRQHNEEYEVLRHIVGEWPSRSVTQSQIDRLCNQKESIEKEGEKLALVLQRRRKQFALLFHVIDELQRTGDERDDDAGGEGGAGLEGAEVQHMDLDS